MSDICLINAGRDAVCFTTGGVKNVWLGTWSKNATYALSALQVITGATSAATVYSFFQDAEYAGLTQKGTTEVANGGVGFETTLTMKFINLDAGLRNSIIALQKAPIVAIVEANNGTTFLAGKETAGRSLETNMNVGVALTDHNGATLSITWKSANGIYLIDNTLVGTSITVG